MKSVLSWKIIAYSAGIFLAGGITGGVVSKVISDLRRPPGRVDFAGRMFSKLQETLELTPAQEKTIKPIVEETSAQLRSIQLATMNQAAEILSESNARLASELTPAQQKKLKEMDAERRERMKKWGRDKSDDRKDRSPGKSPEGDRKKSDSGKPDRP